MHFECDTHQTLVSLTVHTNRAKQTVGSRKSLARKTNPKEISSSSRKVLLSHNIYLLRQTTGETNATDAATV